MKRILTAVLLLAASGLSAAKDKPTVSYPLPPGTPVEFIRDTQELSVLAHPNAAAHQGALAGALINNWMVQNERSIAPLRTDMASAKLEEHFLKAVLAHLPELAPSPKLDITTEAWTSEEIFDKTRDSGGLYVAVRAYTAFTLDLDGMGGFIELWVVRAEKKENGELKETVLDQSRFSFVQHFEGWNSMTGRGSGGIWRGLGTPRLELAFRESIDQVVGMLSYHVSTEGQAEAALKNRKHDEKVHGLKLPGRLVRTGSDWVWFRDKLDDQLSGYGIIQHVAEPAAAVSATLPPGAPVAQ